MRYTTESEAERGGGHGRRAGARLDGEALRGAPQLVPAADQRQRESLARRPVSIGGCASSSIFNQRSHEKRVPTRGVHGSVTSRSRCSCAICGRPMAASATRRSMSRARDLLREQQSRPRRRRRELAAAASASSVAIADHRAGCITSRCLPVDISGVDQQRRFLELVGAYGHRVDASARRLKSLTIGARSRTRTSTRCRIEVFERKCKSRWQSAGMIATKWRQLVVHDGRQYGGQSDVSKGTLANDSRRSVRRNPRRATSCARLATSDVFWDRITEISTGGRRGSLTILTVPGPESWIANCSDHFT